MLNKRVSEISFTLFLNIKYNFFTETAEARDLRKKKKQGENVVRREVCRITSKGTRSLNETRSVADEPYSSFILAITEKVCAVRFSIEFFTYFFLFI